MKIRSPGSNDLVRVDPGPGSFTSRVADVMVRKSISLDGFLQTLIRRPGLNTGSFFLRAGSHVLGRKLRSRSQVPGIKKPGLSRAFYLVTSSNRQRLRQSHNNILDTNHGDCSSCHSFPGESLKNILRPIPRGRPQSIPRFAPR